jgi:hypothetical protein
MPPEFVFDELEKEEKLEKEASVKRENKTEKEMYYNDNSKVQFNLETVVVNTIKSRDDMSFTELTLTWYQVSDFSR